MPASLPHLFAYQPVLDVQGNPVAVSILYPRNGAYAPGEEDDADATSRFIADAGLNSDEVSSGNRQVFIQVDPDFLASGMISMFSSSRVVLELVGPGRFTPESHALCQGFMRMGYRFAAGGYLPGSSLDGMLDVVEIVKIDISAISRDRLSEAVNLLHGRTLILLAENVATRQDFHDCKALGFELFQGHYFADTAVLAAHRPDPRRMDIIRLLAVIESDVDDKEIEDVLKQCPDITVHLLRMINSAAFGLHTRVGSMREVLQYFGREKLAMSLQVLLFVARDGDSGGEGRALLELAMRRGRTIEELVPDVTHVRGSSWEGRGFMSGVLSLVDVLLGRPLSEVLPEMGVAEEIRQAVIQRYGMLGPLLELCEMLEKADFEGVVAFADSRKIALDRIMEVQREAWLWAGAIAEQSLMGE